MTHPMDVPWRPITNKARYELLREAAARGGRK
jgi:hypothetical protein